MKNLILCILEKEEDNLLDLDNIIKLNRKIKESKKIVKILLISNKKKSELNVFINIFNKLIGLDMVDFAISNNKNTIMYIKKNRNLKEHSIKNKDSNSMNYMVQSLINIYSENYDLNSIYYIANNNELFKKLNINNINYKKINRSLYNTLFGLKED